jgi:putative transposase
VGTFQRQRWGGCSGICNYRAETKAIAETELDNLEEKWGKKYPIVIKSWRANWDDLTTYFAYTPEIRKIIYTTNAVEGYHRQIYGK